MRAILRVLPILALSVASAAPAARQKKKAKPPPDPPLQLRITGEKTTYRLALGGKKLADFRKQVTQAEKGTVQPPPTPAVELKVELMNTSGKPVRVWTKGDPVELALELKQKEGEGAKNIAPPLAFTREFRAPTEVELAPGRSVEIPLADLSSGFRMQARRAYWTEPGEYELVATLRTAVNPSPPGAKDAGNGFGVVKLTSPPVKLTVEPAK